MIVRRAGPWLWQSTRSFQKNSVATPSPTPSKRKATSSGDPRYDIAKRILFDAPAASTLTLSTEDQIRHETIHRAWMLHESKRRGGIDKELDKQYGKMQHACRELQELHPKLYRATMAGNSRADRKGFPLTMRVPTDTPPTNGWNYNWVPSSVE